MDAISSDDALRLTFDVWHPGCWVLEVTEQIDVGFLGYGVYTRDDGQATTHFTTYADTQVTIEEALDLVRAHSSVDSVSEMTQQYRQQDFPSPGNARRELLVEHDGTTGYFAFRVAETNVDEMRGYLTDRGIKPRAAFGVHPSDQPVVHPWTVTPSMYIYDSDGNSLELLVELSDDPRSDIGPVSLKEWSLMKGNTTNSN